MGIFPEWAPAVLGAIGVAVAVAWLIHRVAERARDKGNENEDRP